MKSFAEFHRISKYGNSRFKDVNKPYCVGFSEVREIMMAIDLVMYATNLFVWFYLGWSFLAGLLIGFSVHLCLAATVSLLDTIYTRQWRIKMERDKKARDGIKRTIRRLQLNKPRRTHGSEASI